MEQFAYVSGSTTTRLSEPYDSKRFECLLCPIRCRLSKGQAGRCRARICTEHGIGSHSLQEACVVAVEPIEKKPLFHYMPGSKTLSFGSYGCNMACDFCTNWKVSQNNPEPSTHRLHIDSLLPIYQSYNCNVMCFTYNEPLIYFESLIELAYRCRAIGIPFIIKTNGYCEAEPWAEVCSAVNAMNIDWKGTEARYRAVAKTDGATTHRRIEEALASSTHVEISVPIYADASIEEYEDFPKWLASLDSLTPVHLLRIVPAYKSLAQVTSSSFIKRIYSMMREHLPYVYLHGLYDNDEKFLSTTCHICKNSSVQRIGLKTVLSLCSCCPINI